MNFQNHFILHQTNFESVYFTIDDFNGDERIAEKMKYTFCTL